MKHFIFIIILIIFSFFSLTNSSNARSYGVKSYDYLEQNDLTLREKNMLTIIEQTVFGKNYSQDTTNERLERLETRVLGFCQSGTYKERLNVLDKTLSSRNKTTFTTIQTYTPWSYFTPTRPINNYYYNGFNHNRRHTRPHYRPNNRNFINRTSLLKNFFKGAMTGYTLPIQNSYQNYYTNQPNNFSNIFSTGNSSAYYYDNNGYYYNTPTTEGSIGVKIIED